jgi:hypothetical protein
MDFRRFKTVNQRALALFLTAVLLWQPQAQVLAQAAVQSPVVYLPTDTRVFIETRQELVGKGEQVSVGQDVRATVWRDVIVDQRVLIARGTPVIARVDSLKKRNVAGVKGTMTVSALQTETVDGQPVQLSGGYHKEGHSRIALSVTLAVVVFLPLIFIPGKAAELPAGTVFDAYVNRGFEIDVAGQSPAEEVALTPPANDFAAELLYDRLEATEKPKYFEFEITVAGEGDGKFMIDRINSEVVKPMKLDIVSTVQNDGETALTARIKIKKLTKQMDRGYNTIEIANFKGADRSSAGLFLDIEI